MCPLVTSMFLTNNTLLHVVNNGECTATTRN